MLTTRLRLFPDVPGRALRDDERSSAPVIAERFRPGPGDSYQPLGPGPRVPSPVPLLAGRTFLPGQGERMARQLAGLHRPLRASQPYTLADLRGVHTVRRTVVGKSGPMSYTAGYVIPFSGNRGA